MTAAGRPRRPVRRRATSGHRPPRSCAATPPARRRSSPRSPTGSTPRCSTPPAPALRVVANVAVGYDNVDLAAARPGRRGHQHPRRAGQRDRGPDHGPGARRRPPDRRGRPVPAHRGTPWVWGPRMLTGLDLSAGATPRRRRLRPDRPGRRPPGARRSTCGCWPRRPAVRLTAGRARRRRVPRRCPTCSPASDVVTLHCPLDPADAPPRRRRRAGPDAADGAAGQHRPRAAIVDTDALVAALDRGPAGRRGAGRLRGRARASTRDCGAAAGGPHTRTWAAPAPHTREAMCGLAVRNVAAVLAGRSPLTPVG